MPVKKEEGKKLTPKKRTPKTTAKSEKENVEVKQETPKREFNFETKPKEKRNLDIDLTKDFNTSSTFDIELYRAIFMELRRQMDELSAKRGKSEKAYAEYDDAVYNITSNAITNCSAQDFLGYCYKKGFYDFCIMNYEKYMKWTILAASNGNAFSVSKLQVYLTTALDSLDSVDHSVLIDFLDITDENYVLFLSKLLCDELVEILEISPEELVKMPEKFMEQTEEIQKVFDKAKMEAANRVIEKLNKAAQTLNDEIEKEQAEERKLREEEQKKEEIEEQKEEVPSEEAEPKQEVHEESNLFKRKPGIKKKFRY